MDFYSVLVFDVFGPFLGISRRFWHFWGFAGDLGVLGVLVTYMITKEINWFWGGIEGVLGKLEGFFFGRGGSVGGSA